MERPFVIAKSTLLSSLGSNGQPREPQESGQSLSYPALHVCDSSQDKHIAMHVAFGWREVTLSLFCLNDV